MKNILLFSLIFLNALVYSQNGNKRSLIGLPEELSQMNEEELSQIASHLGNFKIVGITERIHGFKEPFIFRNELIKYLVNSKQIDIILLESGFLESKFLNDYIHSKTKDLDEARINGFSSGKHTIEENIQILEWLRNYNSDLNNSHKVDLYGFDVSGSMGAGSSKSEMNTPIKSLVSFLDKTSFDRDGELLKKLKPRIDSLKIKPFASDQENLPTYDKLIERSRNEVTSILNDLISNLEIYRYDYIAQTSQKDFHWAYIAAISARQIDNILRKLPLPGEIMTPEKIDNSFFARLNAMVQNVEYVLHTNSNSRFLIFAASNHLFKAPVETFWPGSEKGVIFPITVGTYLSSQYPDDYKLISHFYLNAENQKKSLQEDPAIFSNQLSKKSGNYFISLNNIDEIEINKQVKIDQESFLIPASSFDYILFTEKISKLQRKK